MIEKIIEIFCSLKQEQVECILIELMKKRKLSFKTLSEAYAYYLEEQNDDKFNQLIEAETIIAEDIFWQKKMSKDKVKRNHQLRGLYYLNQTKRFKMDTINDKLQYNEDEAKELSWYEKNKKTNFL